MIRKAKTKDEPESNYVIESIQKKLKNIIYLFFSEIQFKNTAPYLLHLNFYIFAE